MLKKYFLRLSIVSIFLSSFIITYAQEEKEQDEGFIIQQENIGKYIEVIASDSAMRIDMMNLIIEKCQGNHGAMLEIGRTIIRDPEMHKMMKKMLKNDEGMNVPIKTGEISKKNMTMESTKQIKKPKYDSD